MTDPVVLDDLDRHIVCALQVNPRSSWERIGAALGVSDRTVARRVALLRDSGALRFVALLDETRCGLGSTLHLSATALPGARLTVAAALAERADVRYVVTCAGGADVVAEVVVADRAAQHQFLDVELPAIAGLASVRSQVILRTYTTVASWNSGLLDPGQRQALTETAEPSQPEPHRVETGPEDLSICSALAHDGRASYGAVAAQVGLSEPTVRRRVQRLVNEGALHFRTEVEPRLLGFEAEAELRLTVPFERLDTAARALADHAAVRYVGATAGGFNLSVEAAFHDHDEMYMFLTTFVPTLQVSATDVYLISLPLKRVGLRKLDGLLAPG